MEQPARGLAEDLQVRLTDQEPLSCHDVYMPNHCVASFGSDFPYLVVLGVVKWSLSRVSQTSDGVLFTSSLR